MPYSKGICNRFSHIANLNTSETEILTLQLLWLVLHDVDILLIDRRWKGI